MASKPKNHHNDSVKYGRHRELPRLTDHQLTFITHKTPRGKKSNGGVAYSLKGWEQWRLRQVSN